MCSEKSTQILLAILNVIYGLVGGTLLGLGIWFTVDPDASDIVNILDSVEIWSVSIYLMIAVGAFIVFVAIIGLVGAIVKNNAILILYAVLMVFTILVEIIIIILASVFYSQINNDLRVKLRDQIRYNYTWLQDDDDSKSWDAVHQMWSCCGSNGYLDFNESVYHLNNPNQYLVPASCCATNNITLCNDEAINGNDPESFKFVNVQGCYDNVENFIEKNSIIIIVVVVLFCLLQFVTLMLACAVRSHANDVGHFA